MACATSMARHARFSCIGRAYEYRIVNRRAPLTWDKGLSWQLAKPLDAEAMHGAAQALVGRHDFTTFRSVHCQAASPVKTLDRISVSRHGDEIIIETAARWETLASDLALDLALAAAPFCSSRICFSVLADAGAGTRASDAVRSAAPMRIEIIFFMLVPLSVGSPHHPRATTRLSCGRHLIAVPRAVWSRQRTGSIPSRAAGGCTLCTQRISSLPPRLTFRSSSDLTEPGVQALVDRDPSRTLLAAWHSPIAARSA